MARIGESGQKRSQELVESGDGRIDARMLCPARVLFAFPIGEPGEYILRQGRSLPQAPVQRRSASPDAQAVFAI